MLSRVANSIYWMCRYVERAENVARFIDVNHHLTLDLPSSAAEQWSPLVDASGDMELFEARYDEPTAQNVTRFMTFDLGNPNSILSSLRGARENARSVREVISSEMWNQLNWIYLFVAEAAKQPFEWDDSHHLYETVKRNSHLFVGVSEDTMSHTEGWHFGRMGRLIERADKTSRILDVKYYLLLPDLEAVGTPYDNIQWAAVLKSASALEMYRKRFQRIWPRHVAEFLILDANFPRAMRSCLMGAQSSLREITGAPEGTHRSAAERSLGRLRSELDFTDMDEVFRLGMHEWMDAFQAKLNEVGSTIYGTFFALRGAAFDPAASGGGGGAGAGAAGGGDEAGARR
ncbi:MAG: alpha-E domain-containing protein [Planctomycetota bacterium]